MSQIMVHSWFMLTYNARIAHNRWTLMNGDIQAYPRSAVCVQ